MLSTDAFTLCGSPAQIRLSLTKIIYNMTVEHESRNILIGTRRSLKRSPLCISVKT